jgi:hypothetical protein
MKKIIMRDTRRHFRSAWKLSAVLRFGSALAPPSALR